MTKIKGAILTVRRPNGQVDEVVFERSSDHGVIIPTVFAQMVEATRKAGRGEIIGQRPNVVAMTADEIAEAAKIAGERAAHNAAESEFRRGREWIGDRRYGYAE